MAVMKQNKKDIIVWKWSNVERHNNKDNKLSDLQYEENNIKNKHADYMPNYKHIIFRIDLTFLVTTLSLLLWRSICAIFLLL